MTRERIQASQSNGSAVRLIIDRPSTSSILLSLFHASSRTNLLSVSTSHILSESTTMPEDYRSTSSANGFGNRIGWGSRPALILIDVCTAYWTPGSPLDTSSNTASVASLDVMRRLLASARESKIPVIWTTVQYKSDMSDAGLFFKKAKQLSIWAEGDERGLAEWVEGLVPKVGEEVVAKRCVEQTFMKA